MPPKNINEASQIKVVRDPPVFSEDDASKIIKETIHSPKGHKRLMPHIPNPQLLAYDLNFSYKEYQGWRDGWDSFKTKRILLNRLKDAMSKTNKTIKSYETLRPDIQNLMQINQSEVLFATEDAIDDLMIGLPVIYEHLNFISDLVLTNDHYALKRNGRNAETYFMGEILPDVYSKHFGKEPSRSTTPDGKPTGPMIRFIRSCMEHLNINVTDEAIASSRQRPSSEKST